MKKLTNFKIFDLIEKLNINPYNTVLVFDYEGVKYYCNSFRYDQFFCVLIEDLIHVHTIGTIYKSEDLDKEFILTHESVKGFSIEEIINIDVRKLTKKEARLLARDYQAISINKIVQFNLK